MAAAASASKPPGHHHHQTRGEKCAAGSVPIRRNSSRANLEVAEMVRRASPFERPATGGNASFDLLTSMDTSNGKVEVITLSPGLVRENFFQKVLQ